MDKLINKGLSYYRINLMTGNLIYFTHTEKVNEKDFIEINIKDIILKLEEVVEAYNKILEDNTNLSSDIARLKKEVNTLDMQLTILQNTSQKQVPTAPETPKIDETNKDTTKDTTT